MDWKDSLSQFLADNPDLPEGTIRDDVGQQRTVLPRLDIVLDRKGRRGKSATIVSGFDPADSKAVLDVAAKLKSTLGTGGSTRGGEILIQGDRREDVAAHLKEMGYKTRVIG